MTKLSMTSSMVAILLTAVAHAEIKLPSLAEAREISKASGKPILAMAGQKT